MIVYACVNDDKSKRAHESNGGAYSVFCKMLESGHPPDDWGQLMGQAELAGCRLQRVFGTLSKQGPPKARPKHSLLRTILILAVPAQPGLLNR